MFLKGFHMEEDPKIFYSRAHGVYEKTHAKHVQTAEGFEVGMKVLYPRVFPTGRNEMLKGTIRSIHLNVYGTNSQEYFTLVGIQINEITSTTLDIRDIAHV